MTIQGATPGLDSIEGWKKHSDLELQSLGWFPGFFFFFLMNSLCVLGQNTLELIGLVSLSVKWRYIIDYVFFGSPWDWNHSHYSLSALVYNRICVNFICIFLFNPWSAHSTLFKNPQTQWFKTISIVFACSSAVWDGLGSVVLSLVLMVVTNMVAVSWWATWELGSAHMLGAGLSSLCTYLRALPLHVVCPAG